MVNKVDSVQITREDYKEPFYKYGLASKDSFTFSNDIKVFINGELVDIEELVECYVEANG